MLRNQLEDSKDFLQLMLINIKLMIFCDKQHKIEGMRHYASVIKLIKAFNYTVFSLGDIQQIRQLVEEHRRIDPSRRLSVKPLFYSQSRAIDRLL